MRSGLVMIGLQEDAVPGSQKMNGKGVWLAAVATLPRLENFPMLNEVTTNGVQAVRSDVDVGGRQ